MIENEVLKEIKLANILSSDGKYKEALAKYLSVRGENYYQDTLTYFIGGCYMDMEDWENGLVEYTKALDENPNDEHASLASYVCFVKLEKYEEAISEFERFAVNNQIEMYKDTIDELMQDLKNGSALIFKERIFNLAMKFNIAIPKELLSI